MDDILRAIYGHFTFSPEIRRRKSESRQIIRDSSSAEKAGMKAGLASMTTRT
jgi:hypothetical protein